MMKVSIPVIKIYPGSQYAATTGLTRPQIAISSVEQEHAGQSNTVCSYLDAPGIRQQISQDANSGVRRLIQHADMRL